MRCKDISRILEFLLCKIMEDGTIITNDPLVKSNPIILGSEVTFTLHPKARFEFNQNNDTYRYTNQEEKKSITIKIKDSSITLFLPPKVKASLNNGFLFENSTSKELVVKDTVSFTNNCVSLNYIFLANPKPIVIDSNTVRFKSLSKHG